MASKFVIAVALFAICHSSPVDDFRGRRAYTAAIGSSTGYSGKTRASAEVNRDKADAQAENDNGVNGARDAFGNNLPSQAYARVSTDYNPGDAVGLGYAQPAYYPLPAPATVVTYQKYADVPADIPSQNGYEAQPAPALAQSTAVIKDGYGSANSDAHTGYGIAASTANTQGSGQSAASSRAQSYGPATSVEPAVIAAKAQGLHSVYTPAYVPVGHNSASSNANVNGYHGSATSAARTGPTRKSISWRFGTAYDQPAAYGAAKAAANFDQGSAAAKSVVSDQGLLSTNANTHGAGIAQAGATNNAYGSSVKSTANTFGAGYGTSNANINNANNAVLRYDNINAGYGGVGGIKSFASAQDSGSAISNAGTDLAGNKHVDSVAKSNHGGSGQSAAYINGGAFGLRSNGGWGGHIASDSRVTGDANASSNARTQDVSTGYRVVNSIANSNAFGSAASRAYID